MKESIKKSLKIFSMYILIFIILISSYMVLMTLSSLIPSSLLKNNVIKCSETLEREGEKVKYNLGYKYESIFTFTDALMINTAYSIDSVHPIESFIFAKKNYIPGQTKKIYPDSKHDLGANEKYKNDAKGELYQTKELYGLMHGDNIEDSYEYARYWHGYLVLLRPLLVLFDYSAIRIILFIVTLILIGMMLYLIYKKIDLTTAFIFAIGLLAINIFILTKVINGILIFWVAFISSIVLLLKQDKIKNIGIFFFIVGSVASFIDLLTTPIVTLGLTAIIYFLLLQKKKNVDFKTFLKEMLKIGISWSLGYGLTWATKWIITEFFFGRPMMTQVLEQISFRTTIPSYNGVALIKNSKIITENLRFLSKPVILNVLKISMIYIIVKLTINRKKKILLKENIKNCIPYVVTFFFPFVWMLVIKQHSIIHGFFVYRILIISIISLLLIVYKISQVREE